MKTSIAEAFRREAKIQALDYLHQISALIARAGSPCAFRCATVAPALQLRAPSLNRPSNRHGPTPHWLLAWWPTLRSDHGALAVCVRPLAAGLVTGHFASA